MGVVMRQVPIREESDPVGRDPDLGHGYEVGDGPMPPALPDWRAFPDPRRGWWSPAKAPGVLLLVLLAGCASHKPPSGPAFPATDPGRATILWRSPDQVEVGWTGMPAVVRGGSEASVLRLQATVTLPGPRVVSQVESFMGFDAGDMVEADVQVYDSGNAVVYRRSLHLEGGVPDCYDAFAHAGPQLARETTYLVVQASCRVNGVNGNPEHPRYSDLSARCHFLTTITFEGRE